MSLIGRTLARYEILDEISRGGMGIVYRARDTRLNREVALKVLPPELVADPARRSRFVQEARAASALEHPHIAVIHEIDEVDGISFIAMELLRGERLADMTARGPLPPGRALDLGAEVAEGLARAHDKGIVHRDLKPANVVLTEDEHAKIIDFGLAKLIETLSGDSGGLTIAKAETDPGMVLGTVSYMSPEQARGGKVDHRSDIFSFGILLHEMLTGRPPFRGNTSIDTMHAILHEPAPPLPPLGATVSPEATGDVQRILEKCLAKDPAERYQGMRDVVVDLRAARRKLESTIAVSALRTGTGDSRAAQVSIGAAPTDATAPATSANPRFSGEWLMRARGYVFAAAGVFVLALLGYNQWRPRQSAAPASSTATKPSIAVLYFENNTGNPQLDWLRTGLTDMLVTDLSQSPDVEVLGTDRLVQILTDLRRQDDRVVSFDVVQEIAKRAGVTSVLLGSYVKAGDTIRINTKLQEVSTGRIVTSERVEATGESNLFPTVDELTRRIKAKFALPAGGNPTVALIKPPSAESTPQLSVDRDLKDVTTSSIEAYRYYAEGVDLHQRGREMEAIPLLEKAVQIDPSFAMAYGKLAVVHNNLIHPSLAEEYGKRALEHIEHLTPRERYYIEGVYYTRRNDDVARAIDAYKKAIELYPDHASARHNLATVYVLLERYADAIPQFEELRRRGMTFPSTSSNLAGAYARTGDFEKGYQVLQEYLRTNPENASAQRELADLLTAWGKLDEAWAATGKADALAPGNPFTASTRLEIAIQRGRFDDADVQVNALRRSTDSFARWRGDVGAGQLAYLKGRPGDAIASFEAATAGQGPNGSPLGATSRVFAGWALLDAGKANLALTEAQHAVKDARGQIIESEALELALIAESRLGHRDAAQSTLDDLSRRAAALPSDREKRRVHHAAGVLALERHDTARAIAELKQADAMLPPGNTSGPPVPDVRIWFDLATAQLEAGNFPDAKATFERIVNGGTKWRGYPMQFVRSLYFLGQINERNGDGETARSFYRRFVQYWGDGEIDRERVAEARKKLK